MGRRKIVAGNWKMNTTLEEGLQLARVLSNTQRPDDVLTILAVPYTHLKTIFDQTMHVPNLEIAAQNCHHEDSGAYTGEISIPILNSIGIPYVILGHSERRKYFGETNSLLNVKLAKVLLSGMSPVFCCGESIEIRKSSEQNQYVIHQLKKAFHGLDKDDVAKIIIAYEPIWAIGTGETATPGQVQEMHHIIRNYLSEEYGDYVSGKIPILYGGSVNDSNADKIFKQKDVDGGLIGGASLNFDIFTKIIYSF